MDSPGLNVVSDVSCPMSWICSCSCPWLSPWPRQDWPRLHISRSYAAIFWGLWSNCQVQSKRDSRRLPALRKDIKLELALPTKCSTKCDTLCKISTVISSLSALIKLKNVGNWWSNNKISTEHIVFRQCHCRRQIFSWPQAQWQQLHCYSNKIGQLNWDRDIEFIFSSHCVSANNLNKNRAFFTLFICCRDNCFCQNFATTKTWNCKIICKSIPSYISFCSNLFEQF